MKYIKLFENFEEFDPYELMIISPGKKADMIMDECHDDYPNMKLIETLITMGADINWKNEEGFTCLHKAVQFGHKEIVTMLLDAGADGIIVPSVNSAAEARKAVDSVKYPPYGKRGVGLSRAQSYGFGFEKYRDTKATVLCSVSSSSSMLHKIRFSASRYSACRPSTHAQTRFDSQLRVEKSNALAAVLGASGSCRLS